MTDEEREILASFKAGGHGKPSVVGGNDAMESKAGRSGIAAHCPVCKYWFEVDDYDVLKHMLRRNFVYRDGIRNRAFRTARVFLEANWGVRFGTGKDRRCNFVDLRGKSIGRIESTGIGRGMRRAMQSNHREGRHAFMGIGWNYSETFGDNFFYCPIGEFFEVMRMLMDDSPLFIKRMQTAIATSLKGAGSRPSKVVDGVDGLDDLEGFFDDPAAVRI